MVMLLHEHTHAACVPILPVPSVYPISKEREKQKDTGMGLQINTIHPRNHGQRCVSIA